MSQRDSHSGAHPTDIHVGRRISERRQLLGHSQTRLAEAIGLTFQQVQKYERGVNRVSASKLYDIAASLGVDIGYFFEGIDEGASGAGGPKDDLVPLTSHGIAIAQVASKLSVHQRQLVLEIMRQMMADRDVTPEPA